LRFTFGQHPDGGDPELLAECMQVGTIGPDDVQRGSEKPIPGQGQDNVGRGARVCGGDDPVHVRGDDEVTDVGAPPSRGTRRCTGDR